MDISLTPDLEEKKKRKNKKERNLEDGWLKELTHGSIATGNSSFVTKRKQEIIRRFVPLLQV